MQLARPAESISTFWMTMVSLDINPRLTSRNKLKAVSSNQLYLRTLHLLSTDDFRLKHHRLEQVFMQFQIALWNRAPSSLPAARCDERQRFISLERVRRFDDYTGPGRIGLSSEMFFFSCFAVPVDGRRKLSLNWHILLSGLMFSSPFCRFLWIYASSIHQDNILYSIPKSVQCAVTA